MTSLFVLLALAVIGATTLVALGRLGSVPAALEPDLRPVGTAEDPTFDVVLRGYRMDEVDGAIASLRAEIAELRGRTPDVAVDADRE